METSFALTALLEGQGDLPPLEDDGDDDGDAVMAAAAQLGEAGDFGKLIDLAVRAGPATATPDDEVPDEVSTSADERTAASALSDDLKRVADTSGAAGGAVLATACFARIEELCAAGSSARAALRAADAVAVAVRALGRTRDDAAAQASGCRALARLAAADARCRSSVSRAGGALAARRALEAQPVDGAVAEAASALLCTLALLNPEASSVATLPLADGDDEEAAALAAARRRQEQPLPADEGGVSQDGAGAGGPMAMVVDGSIAPDAILAPPPAPTLDDFLLSQPRLGMDDVGQLAF